ncbi:uncharacterized protein EDB93DRAFT_577732 [Suillus bovinus]|uniref:uncharacterized protein n=1 Tax=Suillus bovinus TaxID=48563 RepID=UPI001B87E227|nr:uncharacterized protein EDB93DRAFT_577732 [Suillus bovinus]KAG2143515.1 hypothetical protein EDB93DRAFT_577732 [Suillus bovinus]
MAQSGGHWHPNPQLMQQNSIPQGWQGTWPPPAGVALPPNFPGPPPMPPGANTHPHWKAGFWQYNPTYNMNAGSGVPWAPGMGWAQNVPANFNPYKRVPRPPSPSYWKTQLSDNGLGLENMVPARTDRDRESTRDVQGDAVPQTPWIWNPPSLLPTSDGADRATPTRDFNNRRSSQDSIRSNSTPASYGPSQRGSQDSHNTTSAGTPVRDYFYSHPASRHGSVDSLGSRSQGFSQHSISSATPPPPSSHGRMNSIYSSRTSSSGPQFVPPFPAPPSSSSSMSTAISSSATRVQQPLQAPMFTREPESFMRSDLQTTSSSNVGRTPTHYPGTRRHTDEALDHPSRSSSAPHTSASASRGLSVPEPLLRHHSLPTTSSPPSIGSLSTFTEDMGSVLSPLINSAQRSAAPSSLTRSRTEPVIPPAHLSTIPESMSSSSHSSAEDFFYPLSAPPDSDEESPESSPLRNRVRTREIERERERERERHRERSRSYERANHLTPYRNGSRSSNPLPPPPMERPNPVASAPPHQSPEPAHYTRRIRKGFWNRRGDYLTSNSYVVYAPEERAYPAELQHYPSETEGYKDQYGAFVPYLAARPELPASLPYHGRPPAQPYDSFVVYSYY